MSLIYLGLATVAIFTAYLVYKKRRFRMLKHYIEYVYMGDFCNTGDYGPLDDLAANGLLKEITRNGGKVLYHRSGTSSNIHDIIRLRDTQLAESGLAQVVEKYYKDTLN